VYQYGVQRSWWENGKLYIRLFSLTPWVQRGLSSANLFSMYRLQFSCSSFFPLVSYIHTSSGIRPGLNFGSGIRPLLQKSSLQKIWFPSFLSGSVSTLFVCFLYNIPTKGLLRRSVAYIFTESPTRLSQ